MFQNLFLFLIVCLSTATTISQNEFQNGYYINVQGDKISGLIKVENWKNNPSEIVFKSTESDSEKKITLGTMKGFGYGMSIRYEKFKVKVSKAASQINELDRVKEFTLEEEVAMIKLIVDGSVQLYQYENRGITQFFIKKDNELTALLYKRFLVSDGVATNNLYKQQISNLLKCDSGQLPKAESLTYKVSSLKNFVTKYNICKGNFNEKILAQESNKVFIIKPFAGIQISSLSVEATQGRDFDFGEQTSIIPGLELEMKFPTKNKGAWSIFLDTRIHEFEASEQTSFTLITTDEVFFRETKGVYKAVDFGLGGRYYFTFNESNQFYLGANLSVDAITKTRITYDTVGVDDIEREISTLIFGAGVGYSWKNFNAEIRYYTDRDSANGEFGGRNSSIYSNLAFTLSYSLLKLNL